MRRENAQKNLDIEMNRAHLGVRRVDINACYDLYKKVKHEEAVAEMRQIRNARRHIDTDMPVAKFKFGGQQSLVDVPLDISIEEIILNQTGKVRTPGEPWTCRKCGVQMAMALPMDKCPQCGAPSFIADKTINLRR